MSFDRNRLPDPTIYYETQGLKLTGSGEWRTTRCVFHGGSDSMRIVVKSGGFKCMACGARGGDVVAYHMAMHCLSFVEAAKDLGAWINDAAPIRTRPTPLSPRDALIILAPEVFLIASLASSICRGCQINEADCCRIMEAHNRIQRIAEIFYV